jgi:hypothetical protein
MGLSVVLLDLFIQRFAGGNEQIMKRLQQDAAMTTGRQRPLHSTTYYDPLLHSSRASSLLIVE